MFNVILDQRWLKNPEIAPVDAKYLLINSLGDKPGLVAISWCLTGYSRPGRVEQFLYHLAFKIELIYYATHH